MDLVIESALSAERCADRIRERIPPPGPPIVGSRAIWGRVDASGFTLVSALNDRRTAVLGASGRFRPGSGGSTRIDVRFGPPWKEWLPWMIVTAALMGPLMAGMLLIAFWRGGPIVVEGAVPGLAGVAFATAVAALALQALVGLYLVQRYRVRATEQLRRFLVDALEAR